ncbi:MAG: hypothetical protein AB8B58_11015 [Roseobacter sp.]
MKYLLVAFTLLSSAALADPPAVEEVRATQQGGAWRFDVTLSHADTGWDHYADAWRILDMQGNQIAIRELAHPHVNEQPFTRSLSGVALPQGTTQVQIQARDTPGGWYQTTTIFTLP